MAIQDSVVDLTWGSHICLLYRTAEDLLTFQAPFFQAALRSNQTGIWFVNPPLCAEAVKASFACEESATGKQCGRIELLNGMNQYSEERLEPREMARFWADREAACREAGYAGLRISGNVNEVRSPHAWKQLMEYEQYTDAYLHERRMVSLCCYREDLLGAAELADIISAHQGCLIKRRGDWELIPNHEYRRAEAQTERFFSIGQEMLGIASLTNGEWMAINEAMQKATGCRSDELPPFPMRSLAQPESSEPSAAAETRLSNGESVSGLQQLLRCANGELRWISWNIFCDVEEQLLYCSGRDITSDKAAEEAVKKQLDDAQRLNRLKDQFLAIVSHELRTPLNAILGWAQVLTRHTPGPEQLANGLNAIMRNARAQAELIEDLLDMSRMMSGRLRLEKRLVPVEDIVAAVVDGTRPAITAKNIMLRISLDAEMPLAWADPARLQQIISNLLVNAVMFTGEGGEIFIRSQRVGSNLEISVTDNGEGISPEFLPYVFEAFSQKDASTTREHKGLGLGLSIARRLAEMHGGTVRASSEGEGRGAAFAVVLPPTDESGETSAAPVPGPVESENLQGQLVLIVDDEKDAVEVIAAMLEAHGASTLRAYNVSEAIEAVRRCRPSLVLSDIGMPGEDGYALLQRIRALPENEGRDTAAVAITAFARDVDRQACLRAGFAAHLAKPLEERQLIAAVGASVG